MPLTVVLHVNKHHKAPAKSPHQKHGDLHAVYDQVIEHTEVQTPVPQQKQNDGELVLQPQEHAHADVLQEEEGGERDPKQRGQQTAAEVEEKSKEAVHAAWAQVEVKVVVLGAHQLGRVCRPAGGVHARSVGAMEAAHPPWDGDQRHGWATGAQHGAQVWQLGSTGRAASSGCSSLINS